MTRTIQAPGIELREVDKSQYSKQDYSLVGTTSLVCGVASKGDNYNINWINTTQNFLDTYGAPETEEEKWFYNAANEVLTKGGIFLGARIPYENEANTGFNLAYTEYSLNPSLVDVSSTTAGYPRVNEVDTALSTCFVIQQQNGQDGSGYMPLSAFDRLKVNETQLLGNKIRIVDITRSQYERLNVQTLDPGSLSVSIAQHECLGIMPVLVTPANALYYQGLISSVTKLQNASGTEIADEQTGYVNNNQFVADLSCYSPVHDFKQVYKVGTYTDDRNEWQIQNFGTPIDSASINAQTVSKTAVSQFPTISFADQHHLDKQFLKHIGLVVFKLTKCKADAEKLEAIPVESFVGSLDKSAKDELTKQSTYICDIVNSQSQLVNMFVSMNAQCKQALKDADIIAAHGLVSTSLGFYESMCRKVVTAQGIASSLNIILDLAKDTNKYNIDLVIDAGVSNMAQRVHDGASDCQSWQFNPSQTSAWKSVLQKLDVFCSSARRDCMLIADGLRTLCLEGDQQIVRSTNPFNTVEKNILPRVKVLASLNSSYTAGYCDWFQSYDAFSGDKLWLPPSIKMAGVYIYTDAYFNKWDAPAGVARGKLTNVINCAFSPTQKEAEKIYLQGWNYAVSYPIDGIVVEGQKTQQLRPTAFDRVNVRRLFLHLEKEVSRIAKYFLYEGNTEYQRNRFVDAIKPIFDSAVNHNGIIEYYIKCDAENNTSQAIDNNELHCAIAVKPVKSIEFIVLTFVCTNQSAIVTESLAGMRT